MRQPDEKTAPEPSLPPEASQPKLAKEDFESVILMRMRQAERDRLAKEILDAEEKGGS